MTRNDAVQLMSCRLYDLLGLMMRRWRCWSPKIGYPASSCGFSSGGSVSEFEDLEDEVDSHAVKVIEAGWDSLTPSEKICLEMIIGTTPWVWVPREGVMESAIAKMEKKLREIG